jgi:hypothetical protein
MAVVGDSVWRDRFFNPPEQYTVNQVIAEINSLQDKVQKLHSLRPTAGTAQASELLTQIKMDVRNQLQASTFVHAPILGQQKEVQTEQGNSTTNSL